ncbi:hypothetical protein GCM10023205_16680 [Yinghuangia aomiensis]|uniref:Barstar (barnase inhibitor) domain-containing protein n=1 Tax=Yinghuangia aomiensis TaxID=676205 RepID=A0ABP9GWK6_9ACTN
MNADEDEVLGECRDIDGLFVPDDTPPRNRLVLLGCSSADAISEAFASPARPSYLEWEELDRDGDAIGGYYADAPHLVDIRPCLRDLRRHDVVVEYGDGGAIPGTSAPPYTHFPFSSGYRLRAHQGDTARELGTFRQESWFVTYDDEPDVPMTLVGCAPGDGLRRILASTNPRRRGIGPVLLYLLDRDGDVAHTESCSITVGDARPSRLGDGLLDITVTGPAWTRPVVDAAAVWDLWLNGRPTKPGSWIGLAARGRAEWLSWAVPARAGFAVGTSDSPAGAVHELDGSEVTDETGFFCALGEAVNGPGGYFGRCLDALDDCLSGGYGARTPFTLVWRHSEVAARHAAEADASWFADCVDLLRSSGVDVRMS